MRRWLVCAFLFCSSLGYAAKITVDENGNWSIDGVDQKVKGKLETAKMIGDTVGDPFLPNVPVLVYRLPFNPNGGDVVLTDATIPTDLLRFLGGDPRLIFYSLVEDDTDTDLADQAGMIFGSIGRQPNTRSVPEGPKAGNEGNAFADWPPGLGDPGFSGNTTYRFISDAPVAPEPGSIGLLVCGASVLGFMGWRQRRARSR